MTGQSKGPSPSARLIGLVYLLYFLTAISAVLLVSKIVVYGDAASTAANILSHEAVYRVGFAIGLIGTALYVAMTVLFYGLFKHVNKSVALLAAFISLVGCSVQAIGSLFQIAPLVVLSSPTYLNVFTLDQLHALALLFLDLNAQAGSVNIIFFGFFDMLIGYLIFKSTFLPRTIGVFMGLAGLGWLTFLSPALAGRLSPFVDMLGFLAEMVLMLWLLARGVDVQRWNELREAGT